MACCPTLALPSREPAKCPPHLGGPSVDHSVRVPDRRRSRPTARSGRVPPPWLARTVDRVAPRRSTWWPKPMPPADRDPQPMAWAAVRLGKWSIGDVRPASGWLSAGGAGRQPFKRWPDRGAAGNKHVVRQRPRSTLPERDAMQSGLAASNAMLSGLAVSISFAVSALGCPGQLQQLAQTSGIQSV